MRLYFPVDLTGNLIMIKKLVLGEIWTGDLLIFNPDQWRSKGPAGPATAGARGVEGARQEEVVAVNPWPGAQTSCLRWGPKIIATPLILTC